MATEKEALRPYKREVERLAEDLEGHAEVEELGVGDPEGWRTGSDERERSEGHNRTAIVDMDAYLPDDHKATRSPEEVGLRQLPTGAWVMEKQHDPPEKASAREAMDQYIAQLYGWMHQSRETYLDRARWLKASSPLQFSHLTEDQLAQLVADGFAHRLIRAKAEAAVQRNLERMGWNNVVDLDKLGGNTVDAEPVMLPGQVGRVPETTLEE